MTCRNLYFVLCLFQCKLNIFVSILTINAFLITTRFKIGVYIIVHIVQICCTFWEINLPIESLKTMFFISFMFIMHMTQIDSLYNIPSGVMDNICGTCIIFTSEILTSARFITVHSLKQWLPYLPNKAPLCNHHSISFKLVTMRILYSMNSHSHG